MENGPYEGYGHPIVHHEAGMVGMGKAMPLQQQYGYAMTIDNGIILNT